MDTSLTHNGTKTRRSPEAKQLINFQLLGWEQPVPVQFGDFVVNSYITCLSSLQTQISLLLCIRQPVTFKCEQPEAQWHSQIVPAI